MFFFLFRFHTCLHTHTQFQLFWFTLECGGPSILSVCSILTKLGFVQQQDWLHLEETLHSSFFHAVRRRLFQNHIKSDLIRCQTASWRRRREKWKSIAFLRYERKIKAWRTDCLQFALHRTYEEKEALEENKLLRSIKHLNTGADCENRSDTTKNATREANSNRTSPVEAKENQLGRERSYKEGPDYPPVQDKMEATRNSNPRDQTNTVVLRSLTKGVALSTKCDELQVSTVFVVV